MEVALKARADVLTEVSLAVPDVETELLPILEAVHSRVLAVESARAATEEIIAAKVGREIEIAAEMKKRVAEREVGRRVARGEKVRNTAESARAKAPDPTEVPVPEAALLMTMSAVSDEAPATTSLDMHMEEEFEAEEDEAGEAFREGSEKFEEGKHGEAFKAFQKVLRAVEKEKVDEDVRKRLKIDGGAKNESKKDKDHEWDD